MATQKRGVPRVKLPSFGRRGEAASTDLPVYGLIAEFADSEDLVDAAERARAAGYQRMDAYSPFPIEGLPEALGFRTRLPLLVLIGGLTGASLGFVLQWWMSAVDYPINVGGRPYFSWPSFIPATFEMTILFAAFAAVFGMILLNGLPRLYHPIFNTPNFDDASRDKFFLCIEAADPQFETGQTRQFLEGLNALAVTEIKH